VLGAVDAVFRTFRGTTIEEANDTLDYCQKAAAAPILATAEVRLLLPAFRRPCFASSHVHIAYGVLAVDMPNSRRQCQGALRQQRVSRERSMIFQLSRVQGVGAAAKQAAGDRATLEKACAVVRLACEALFSLNVFGLSVHMAELAPRWMAVWKEWLDFHADALAAPDADTESAECAPALSLLHLMLILGFQ
jgi:hypothetical protein